MKNVSARLDTRVSKTDGKKMYYAIFSDPDRRPRRKTVTLRTKDKRVARQKLSTMEREVAMGLFDPWADASFEGVSMGRAVREFAEMAERKHGRGDWSANHAAALGQTAAQFARAVGEGTRTDRVTARDVDSFVWAYDNDNSRWQMYARLKALFTWALRAGYLRSSPLDGAKRPPPPERKPPRFLTSDQLDRVLAAASAIYRERQETGAAADTGAWWAGLFLFAASTGLRVGEIRSLRWCDVDFAGGWVRVQPSRAGGLGPLDGLVPGAEAWPGFVPKWGKARGVPLLPGAVRALSVAGLYPYDEGHPLGERLPHRLVWPSPHALRAMSHGRTRSGMLGRDTIARAWQRSRKRAAVGDDSWTFHSTRHTFASHSLQRGVPMAHLQRAMGHRNIQTTQVYAHTSDATTAGAFREAFGGHQSDSM